ncbi:hypothetical protein [Alteripontixanthobacter muriae]|uniref:hypothetical protein n=1 Tax=Alteripontixanthobacter muriae TaxID=2705546 RepID=UPI001E43F13E|nr:hypothetical protein [Alteripontixanthobacter muriae]
MKSHATPRQGEQHFASAGPMIGEAAVEEVYRRLARAMPGRTPDARGRRISPMRSGPASPAC